MAEQCQKTVADVIVMWCRKQMKLREGLQTQLKGGLRLGRVITEPRRTHTSDGLRRKGLAYAPAVVVSGLARGDSVDR